MGHNQPRTGCVRDRNFQPGRPQDVSDLVEICLSVCRSVFLVHVLGSVEEVRCDFQEERQRARTFFLEPVVDLLIWPTARNQLTRLSQRRNRQREKRNN